MKISATIDTGDDGHDLVVATERRRQTLPVPAKTGGGSAVNGGELLFAALATCFCNDVYREAKKRARISRWRVSSAPRVSLPETWATG
jgi:organic hydroperoxide reductase OsmC/OhrA